MSNQAIAEADQAAGVTPSAPWRLKALTIWPDYRIAVTFQDGSSGIADFLAVKTSLDCGIFDALKDPTFFEQAQLQLGILTWPNGADIDPNWMYEQIQIGKSWSVPF